MTETHCHLNCPPLHRTCEWFCCVHKRGQGGSAAGWELSVFEVGIWSSHLHLMPFRLLVLTRAKHLTRLGLIWWGHGVTPWPPLSVFSKWNQLSHRAGEGRRGVGRVQTLWLDWPDCHWASLAHPSGAACSLLSRHFAGVKPSSSRRCSSPKKSIQSKHIQWTWKEKQMPQLLIALLSTLKSFARADIHWTKEWVCACVCVCVGVCVCVWPARPLLRHLFSFAWVYFLMFQNS